MMENEEGNKQNPRTQMFKTIAHIKPNEIFGFLKKKREIVAKKYPFQWFVMIRKRSGKVKP